MRWTYYCYILLCIWLSTDYILISFYIDISWLWYIINWQREIIYLTALYPIKYLLLLRNQSKCISIQNASLWVIYFNWYNFKYRKLHKGYIQYVVCVISIILVTSMLFVLIASYCEWSKNILYNKITLNTIRQTKRYLDSLYVF